MSTYSARVGQVYVNKYGLLETKRAASKARVKLTVVDQLDKIWLAHAHGALVPSEKTTHLRITCDQVEPHGAWCVTAGSYIVNIDNTYAGERFDQVVPLVQGAKVTTTLHGMQREKAAEVWVQELIIKVD